MRPQQQGRYVLRNKPVRGAQTRSSFMSVVRKLRPSSTVRCHTCSHLVVLTTTERLPYEFSVRCPQCGRRGFYTTSEIQGGTAEPEGPDERPASLLRKAS
jgi:ribosomal protein S27E